MAKESFVNGFVKELRKCGLLTEWIRVMKAGAPPAVLANLFLEYMRDHDKHKLRQACAAFCAFIDYRPWLSVLERLNQTLTPDEQEGFKDDKAEAFYLGLRLLVLAQVNDYWKQFIQTQPQHPLVKKDLDGIGAAEKRLLEFIKDEVSLQMKEIEKTMTKAITDALRRESGEDWKS